MDALTRESHEHGVILERMTFFKNACPIIKMKKDYDQIVVLSKFLNEYVMAHFKYEEKEIFPVLVEKGDSDVRKFVAELKKDHVQIISLVERFFTLLDGIDPSASQDKFDGLTSTVMEIISKTLGHAECEDENLYPVIKSMEKYFSKEGLFDPSR